MGLTEYEFNERSKMLEGAVIGTLIMHPDCYGSIKGTLTPAHFFTPRYGAYFAAVEGLIGDGVNPDLLLVSERIPAGGDSDLAELGWLCRNDGYHHANIAVYAQKVRDQAQYQPKSATHNDVLDNEENYCTVDLLAHIANGHPLKELCKSVAKAAWLPESTVFLVGAAVFASMACRRYSVARQDGEATPVGLYVVAEQPSGLGKTRCIKVFQKPFSEAKTRAIEDRKKKLLELEILAEDDSDAKKELMRLKKTPLPAGFLTNPTPESIDATLFTTGGHFSAVSSEKGLFDSLFGFAYGDNKKSNNNDLIQEGFDGGYVNPTRVSREPYEGYVAGGVCLFAQSGSIEMVIEAGKGDSGLSQRFLLLVEKSLLGYRDLTQYYPINPDCIKNYRGICDGLADALFSGNGIDKVNLSISGGMWAKIGRFRMEYEPHLKDGGKYSHKVIAGAIAKADMQVTKLAAILHLTDITCKSYGEIADRHVDSAISIMRDMIGALYKLCTDKGVIGMTAEFTAVINHLTKSNMPKTERDIVMSLRNTTPFRHMTGNKSNAIKETIKEMVKQGVLTKSYRVSGDEKQIGIYSLGQ